MAQDTAVIANITEQSWTLHRTYGTYLIAGCAPGTAARGGQDCALTEVHPRRGTIDLGDKRILDYPISAREIAEDLCREINADGGDDSFFGAFVCAGNAPTPAELAEAHRRLEEFYRRVVAIADREWERSHSYLFINDVERRAAKWLGLEKEWFYEPKETLECPGCGEKLKPGVAVCRSCGAVLDREKAAALGLVREPVPAVAPVVASGAPKREGKHA